MRLIYLLKIKSNYKLFYYYLRYRLFYIFNRFTVKKINNKFRNYLKSKNITYDFFTPNTYDWLVTLKDYKNKKMNYLEIGSFEGVSAILIALNFDKVIINCVDPWENINDQKSSEGYEHLSMTNIEKNFDMNTHEFLDKIKKNKLRSKDFFFNNCFKFDVIFIDGSHKAKDVEDDCINSWKNLKDNGIMIIDDYFWQNYTKINDNPAYGINSFLKKIKNEYQILKLTKFQLHIKKNNKKCN